MMMLSRVHAAGWSRWVTLAMLALTSFAAAQPARRNHGPDLAAFIRLYQTDSRYIARFHDQRWSAQRFNRLAAFNGDWAERLEGLDFDALDQQGRIDYILLRHHLESERGRLDLDRRRLDEMDPLLPFRAAVQGLEFARRRMEPADPEAAAGVLAAIPDQIKAVRERIEAAKAAEKKEDGPKPLEVSAPLALRAASAVESIKRTLDDWADYHQSYQPAFTWWIRQPREAADKALDDYAKYLRETIAGIKGEPTDPLVGDPIGAEALASDLRGEMLAYSPAELIAIAEHEFAWCEAEMKKAAAEMEHGDDWKKALAEVKKDAAPPGEQDRYVRDVAREAIAFLKERDLITIPLLCEESWRVEMLSPDTQKSLPFAVYGGQYMGVAYPADSMTHDDKLMSMRGNNRHFTRIVTPHELIPGHHLQGFMEDRERPYRSIFSTPFLVEGWALYWEMTLWDLGWGQSPQDRIGMLFWRMHRCARIIVSLRFHLGEMTPQQMIDFLVDRVGHERFGATSEVRRYIGGAYSPLYQCGYMIGGLQLRALYADVVKPGGMTDKSFNDAVLTYNAIPVEMIRAGMTNEPLTRDWRARWKFSSVIER